MTPQHPTVLLHVWLCHCLTQTRGTTGVSGGIKGKSMKSPDVMGDATTAEGRELLIMSRYVMNIFLMQLLEKQIRVSPLRQSREKIGSRPVHNSSMTLWQPRGREISPDGWQVLLTTCSGETHGEQGCK